MQFITGVTAAVYRYNPAIIAQAFASLDALYPGRIGLGIGTGEAMNEVPLGFDWPDAKTRLTRTTEAIQIIKKLWKREGEEQVKKGKENVRSYDDNDHDNDGFLHFNGKYFRIKNAKLYTPPSGKIPMYMAASGEEATRIAGQYTDGLITVQKPDKSKEIFDIFDKSASEQGKDPRSLEKIAKPKISYSEDYDIDISDPRKLEQKAKEEVPDEKVKESTLIVTSIEDLIKPIEEYFKVGYTRVYVHSTSPNEIEFIQAFCDKILTYFNDMTKR
jgi:coenzyme F420-dependent glucose-6-phosphate dehydrogenase